MEIHLSISIWIQNYYLGNVAADKNCEFNNVVPFDLVLIGKYLFVLIKQMFSTSSFKTLVNRS